jgi:hypothetical protein
MLGITAKAAIGVIIWLTVAVAAFPQNRLYIVSSLTHYR